MAGFDLKAHIKGHSFLTSDGLPENFNLESHQNTHFTFSFDKSQFILNHNTTSQQEIDKIMTDFFQDLQQKEQYLFQESNGKGKAPRTRMLDLSQCLLAYHNSSSEAMNNYAVYDHIHILTPAKLKNSKGESTKLGKGYSHLRSLISEVAQRHNLVANFEEATQYEKDKNSKASATSYTWYLKKSTDSMFLKSVNNGNLLKALIKIESAYQKGDTTLDHLFKGYIDLQYRLNKLDIDLVDKQGKNLRYDFPILINQEQKNEISILKSGDKNKITQLIQNRSSKITRACIEQAFGFNSVVYDVLQNKGKLLEGIDLNLIREIASDPSIKVAIEKKDLNQKKKNCEKSLGYHVKQDIETVLKYSTNEKSFRENLQEFGYQNVKFKHKDKQKIGISFTNPHNNKVATIYFNQLRMSMPQITKQLMENKKLQDKDLLPLKPQLNFKDSFLSKYIPKELDQEHINRKKKFQDIQFERIYGVTPTANLTGYYIQESKILKKGTFIDVQDNRIIITHQNLSELENNVKVILDTVISKRWDLNSIIIKGTLSFKLAVQAELERISQNKIVKVQEQKQEQRLSPKPKFKDIDILLQLKSLNLNNYSVDQKPKEYSQVWEIIERAVNNKDIELLNTAYDTLPHQYPEELRLKLINYGKVLNISSKDIDIEIGISMGLRDIDIDVFREDIRSSNGYDEKFLDLYVEKLEEKLTDHYIINQDLYVEKLEVASNIMQRLSKEFNQYKNLYVDQKEYISKVKDIENYLELGCFYSARKLINELDNEDKIIYETKYQNSIDMINVLNKFDDHKERIKEQSELDQKAYFAETEQVEDTKEDTKTKNVEYQPINQINKNKQNYYQR